MAAGNSTEVPQFLLLGLSEDPALQPVLFGLFLSIYLVTILGNLLIILAISSDPHLHTSMYFFLSHLSCVDICFTSTTFHKMLVNIQTQKKDISYIGCLTQEYFFVVFAGLDDFLLTVMAYDRYMAMCRPLHYTDIMKPRLCGLLVLACWFTISWVSLLHTLLMVRLTFCAGTEIPHFFCELGQVLTAACSDALINDIALYVATALLGVFPLTGVLFSYYQIVSSIARMASTEGRCKAFSTCGSHLSVVSLFYGTGLGIYLSAAVTHSPEELDCLSDVHGGHPHAEPLHLQPAEQGCEGGSGKAPQLNSLLSGWVIGLRTEQTLWAPEAQPQISIS